MTSADRSRCPASSLIISTEAPVKRGVVPPTTRPAVAEDKIEDALHEWVEKFFSRNYDDITARKTIEWGKPQERSDGNWQIRYKYQATIRDKNQILCEKLFTSTPAGEVVEVRDAQLPTSRSSNQSTSDKRVAVEGGSI
ncbi:MAG: hypothetical protein ABSB74_11930 [Tepidisphaeraceae bacterium]